MLKLLEEEICTSANDAVQWTFKQNYTSGGSMTYTSRYVFDPLIVLLYILLDAPQVNKLYLVKQVEFIDDRDRMIVNVADEKLLAPHLIMPIITIKNSALLPDKILLYTFKYF